jgi:hypothetical protein
MVWIIASLPFIDVVMVPLWDRAARRTFAGNSERAGTRCAPDPHMDPILTHPPRLEPEPRLGRTTARYFESELKLLPGIILPLRSMLVSVGDTDILISPIGTADEGAALGPNLFLVAPSLLHHIHMKTVIERHRPVERWGPPGFAAKYPELGAIRELGVDPWPHRDVLEVAVIEGAPKRNEVVFFHRASRTLYTADLIFNILEPKGFLTPLTFRMLGIHKRLATMNLWRRWVKDRAAFQRSIDRVLGWDFDRIAMAHGEIVTSGGPEQLERALREVHLLD